MGGQAGRSAVQRLRPRPRLLSLSRVPPGRRLRPVAVPAAFRAPAAARLRGRRRGAVACARARPLAHCRCRCRRVRPARRPSVRREPFPAPEGSLSGVRAGSRRPGSRSARRSGAVRRGLVTSVTGCAMIRARRRPAGHAGCTRSTRPHDPDTHGHWCDCAPPIRPRRRVTLWTPVGAPSTEAACHRAAPSAFLMVCPVTDRAGHRAERRVLPPSGATHNLCTAGAGDPR